MGLIQKWQGVNIFAKVAVILLAVANLFNWLVFCISEWGVTPGASDDTGYGVWVKCSEADTPNCDQLDGWRLSWYGGFQAFMVFGFVAVNLSFLLIVLLVFVDQCGGKKDLNMVCFISCIVAAVCYIIAIIIFAVRFDKTYASAAGDEELHSCFGLAIVIFILMIVAAILVFLAGKGSGGKVSEGSSGGKSSEEKEAERRQKREEQERKKEENRKRKEEEAQRKKEEQERKKEEQRRQKEERDREREDRKK